MVYVDETDAVATNLTSVDIIRKLAAASSFNHVCANVVAKAFASAKAPSGCAIECVRAFRHIAFLCVRTYLPRRIKGVTA